MARRIVLAVLALVAVLLGIVAIPLGLITTNQDRQDFQDESVITARTVANIAEERLDDGKAEPQLDRIVSQLGRDDYRVRVYNAAGRPVDGTPAPMPLAPRDLAHARQAGRETVYPADDWFIIAVPVAKDSGAGNVGTVVLARPSSAVDREAGALWAVIAAVAAAGLVAAGLIAIALARWVSRPLRELEAAAQALGSGSLGARSPAGRGPGEIRRLASNFNLMAARLEALVRGNQTTMADVSHQLRSPLAALRLRLELLAQDSDDAAAAELAGAQEEIARLSRMVNGLLAVARAENIDTPQVDLQVDQLIKTRVAAWRPAADEHSVRLETDLQPATVRMGEGHLEQILDNLIANALDALPPGGTIWLAAIASGDVIKLTVVDNGPGMPQQQRERAFRRFATSNGGGAGLGLAIVDRLAVASGGTATLSDTRGGGLTVTIELPRARAERRRGGHRTPAINPGTGSAAGEN
jgi:signal transduction histidine kinase